MASNIADSRLFEYAGRVRGQTVLITGATNPLSQRLHQLKLDSSLPGAAKGLGREAAIAFGRYGCEAFWIQSQRGLTYLLHF